MKKIRCLVKDWLPPAIFRALRHLGGGGVHFVGNYATWVEAATESTGYDASPILDRVLDATLKVKRGEAVFERDSVLFDEIHYAWPVTAGLMWTAAQSGGRLDVLDFGGALGSCYFQNRQFVEGLQQVQWSVVEQAHYVGAGRLNIESTTLKFYSSIEECMDECSPNVVLLSSVLEYLPDPYEILRIVSRIGADVIIIDRTPFTIAKSDCVKVQIVRSDVFKATIPCRLISRNNLIMEMGALGFSAKHTFPSLGGGGSGFEYSGYIFVRDKQ